MKQNCTLRRMLSALPLFLLLGIFVASCSKDDNETSNPEETNQETTDSETGNTIPEGAHVWEYYSINEDGESVTVTSELSERPYNNDSSIYEIIYIPSMVNIDGKEYRVTSIGNRAFFDCSSLTSISIPESVTSIGSNAFSDCSKLTSVSIPEGVTSIGGYAFYRCSSLTSISIPEGVTSIGEFAFNGCSSLTSISIPDGVTSIGQYAFWGCKSLTSISIPESVTSIGITAFAYCSSLTSITVAANNPVYDSREGCNAIIETASNTLIRGCQNTIIPESVTSIGSYAFYGCSSLTSISLPESVTSIGGSAFSGCSSLTSISIPEGVKSIGDYAFYGCSSLTSISIPGNVTSIGESAFGYCPSLTSVTCYAEKVPELGSNVFYNVLQSATLYVPASALEAYKAADGWKDFGKILPIE